MVRHLAAAAALLLAAVSAHFPPPPGGVYSTAPGAGSAYGYGQQPCSCNMPCSCAPSYGPGYAGWTPTTSRSWTGYRSWPVPSVVSGDAYAVTPLLRPRGPVVGYGPVIGRGDVAQYVNGGSNGGAYVANSIGPVAGSNGYAQSDAYSRGAVPRELSNPIPFGRAGRVNYLGRGGTDGYIRPAALEEGPMTTVKIVLPDGSTRSISIPARFLTNAVDEYVGGANKYVGGPVIPSDPFSPLSGRNKYLSEPALPQYLAERIVPPAPPIPAAPEAEAAARAAAKAAAEAAVGALPADGTAAAEAAAAALGPAVLKQTFAGQPSEAYRSGRDDPVAQTEERRLSNLYRSLLLHEQQDTPVTATKVPEPSDDEIERLLEERRQQPVLPDARRKLDRPANLEDYIVLRKDDPRAIYLRDHLLQLEQQAARDAAAAAEMAASKATIAPSRDPNVVGDNVIRVTEATTPFSHDEQPRILKGTVAELPTQLKKEDVIAELLEQQEAEATDRAAERVVAAKQAKIRKQLIEKQLQNRREEAATAAAAADAATESQQQAAQDELPPGWQIGIRVPTEDNEQPDQPSQPQHKSHSDPRAHFDKEPIDVRQPRPPFRGTLIDDPRLADFRPISNGREVAPSSISRETKSVRQQVHEFPEFFDGLR